MQRPRVHFQGQFGAGADGSQRIAQAVGDGGGHLAEQGQGLVLHQLPLLVVQQAGCVAHEPEQAEVDGRAAKGGGDPEQDETTLHPGDQVHRFLVDLDHRKHFATAVLQGDEAFQVEAVGHPHEVGFRRAAVGAVVLGGHGVAGPHGLGQLGLFQGAAADQLRVGGPDHHAIRGIDVGQQDIGQAHDVVEEFLVGLHQLLVGNP
ncbi:hypothetical protein D3C72_1646290 [compost metagenome]